MGKTSKRKISSDLPATTAPLKILPQAIADGIAVTVDKIAAPSRHMLNLASCVEKQRYPYAKTSDTDYLYLAMLSHHARKAQHIIDCPALQSASPNCGNAYGGQSCTVNGGRLIRLVKLGWVALRSGSCDTSKLAEFATYQVTDLGRDLAAYKSGYHTIGTN